MHNFIDSLLNIGQAQERPPLFGMMLQIIRIKSCTELCRIFLSLVLCGLEIKLFKELTNDNIKLAKGYCTIKSNFSLVNFKPIIVQFILDT